MSILATVFALGISFTVTELLRPLRRAWLVVVMVVVNAAAIPAIAWGLAEAFPINDRYVGGLTLATLGAGSAAGLKAAQLSRRADLPLTVSLVVTLQLVNLVAVPLWAGQVVSGASISAVDILKSLLALVLLPLVVGLVVRARYAEHAAGWRPELDKIANLALVIALAAGITVNWDTITSLFGSWVLLASIAIVAVILAGIGHRDGGRGDDDGHEPHVGHAVRVVGADHHRHPARWECGLPRPGHHLRAPGPRHPLGGGPGDRAQGGSRDGQHAVRSGRRIARHTLIHLHPERVMRTAAACPIMEQRSAVRE